MQDGTRIKVVDMTDNHLLATIRVLRWWGKRTRVKLQRATFRELIDAHLMGEPEDWWINEEERELFYEDLSWLLSASNDDFVREYVPCFDLMISEGKRRGLLNEKGYRVKYGQRKSP